MYLKNSKLITAIKEYIQYFYYNYTQEKRNKIAL